MTYYVTVGTTKTVGQILPGKAGAFVDHEGYEKIIIPYGSIFNASGRLISIEMNVLTKEPFESVRAPFSHCSGGPFPLFNELTTNYDSV